MLLSSKSRPLRFIHTANIFKAEEEKATESSRGKGVKQKQTVSELKAGASRPERPGII